MRRALFSATFENCLHKSQARPPFSAATCFTKCYFFLHLRLKYSGVFTEQRQSQNKQKSKMFQRKAKLRLVRRHVSQDLAAFCQPWIASTRSPPLLRKRKTVFFFVAVDLGDRVSFFCFFLLHLSSSPRNFLSTAPLNERHGTQRTNRGGLGFLPSVAAETFSPIPPHSDPPPLSSLSSMAQGFAVALFVESRGAGVRGPTEDEALKSRK